MPQFEPETAQGSNPVGRTRDRPVPCLDWWQPAACTSTRSSCPPLRVARGWVRGRSPSSRRTSRAAL